MTGFACEYDREWECVDIGRIAGPKVPYTVAMSRAALLVLLLAAAPASADGFKVGEPVPDLRLPTIDGKTASLRGYRGKKVLLIQFASW